MRLIIAFFLCVLATAGYAQFPASQQTGAPKTIIRNKGGAAADSGTVLSVNFTDTTQANLGFLKGVPNIVIVANDTLWRRNNAATQWVKVGVGGGGGSTVDSFFYQLRQLNDTTVLFDRGDGVVDTLAISGSGGGGGSGLNKVDSVTTIGDSLFYWINGDSFFSANLALSVVDGDTSALSVVDSTGQPARRVLFSAPNNKISSTKFFLYDTVNNKLVIGTPIISAGTGSKLFVNGNASFQGNVIADTGYFNRVGLVTRTITFNADSMRVNGLDQVADTSRFKPQVYDPINETWGYFDRWPVTPSIDTTSLSNRINLKLNISDTAAMLSPYLKVADTAGTGSLYIRNQFATQENKKFSVIQGKVDALDFNATSSIADSTQRLTWDDGNGTLNIGLKGGQVNLAVGQEQVARVYNDAGVTLNDGDIVYITGAQGNRVKVQKAVNTDAAIAYATLGMVTETITAGSEGFVTILGTVNHLNTSSFAEGTELYLSGTAGGYTDTKPSYPAAIVSIGRVERSHATVGSIYVNVRPELPTVASYGKNAGGDSTILLMSNGQRFAAKDSAGGGGGGGVTTVGTFSGSSQTNGATISGSTITFGPADATNPGMVSTGAQTIAGNKTLTGITQFGATSVGGDKIILYKDAVPQAAGIGFANAAPYVQNFATSSFGWSWNTGNTVQAAGTNEVMRLTGTGDLTIAGTFAGTFNLAKFPATQGEKVVLYDQAGTTGDFGIGINNATNMQLYSHPNFAITFNNSGGLNGDGVSEMMRLKNGTLSIGTTSTTSTAILDVSATLKGVLFPRTTGANITGTIVSPAAGLMLQSSDVGYKMNLYNGSYWTMDAALATALADKTATNTTSETSLISSSISGVTDLKRYHLDVGNTIVVKAIGYIKTNGSGQTIDVKLKYNSTALASTGAIALNSVAANSMFEATFYCTLRTKGNSGTMMTQGEVKYHDGTNWVYIPVLATSPVTINTFAVGAHQLDLTGTWGAANVNNVLTITNLIINQHN